MTSRAILKTWFETGDKPTQNQFAELIDSLFHRTEDSLEISAITGLQDALDSKQPITEAEDITPNTWANGGSGYVVVGSVTTNFSVLIHYTIARGTLREIGTIILDNINGNPASITSDIDDCGLSLEKEISGTEIRITWEDTLEDGNNSLFYIMDIKRAQIPS